MPCRAITQGGMQIILLLRVTGESRIFLTLAGDSPEKKYGDDILCSNEISS